MNTEETLQEYGSIILRARKARGWTQEVLADLAGVSFPTVSKVECGRSVMVVKLLAILDALDMDLSAFKRLP